jgi:hypothetical protein
VVRGFLGHLEMNDISLGLEVYVIALFFFSAAAIPAVIVVYFINLWINREDPIRKRRCYQPPLTKIEKLIRSSAGMVMIVLGMIVLSWPLYCAFVLREPEHLREINFSGGLPVITLGMKKLSLIPSLLFTVGLICLRPIIAPILHRQQDE